MAAAAHGGLIRVERHARQISDADQEVADRLGEDQREPVLAEADDGPRAPTHALRSPAEHRLRPSRIWAERAREQP